MIQVVMDSSVFLHDPYRKRASTQTLEKLAERDAVKLHLPNIVEREVRSNLLKKLDRNLEESLGYLHKTAERLAQDSIYIGWQDAHALKKKLEEVQREFETLRGTITERTDDSFARWLGRMGVARYPFEPSHATQVFNSYFADTAPFDATKRKESKEKREHIPDAFILEAVRELAADENISELHVLCADNNLSACCAATPKVKVYPSVESFLQDGPCLQYLIDNGEYVYFNLDRVHEGLFEYSAYVHDAIKDRLEFELEYLRRRDVKNLPSRYEEFSVRRVRDFSINFEYGTTEYYLDSVTSKMEIEAKCDVEFYDDHDFSSRLCEDTRKIKVKATLKAELPSIDHSTLEMTDEAIEKLMTGATFSIESFESLELLDDSYYYY